MTTLFINWCKMMFTQNGNSIRVSTGVCQEGAMSARGQVTQSQAEDILTVASLFAPNPLVELQENTVFLNRKEVSFINKEVKVLLKNQIREMEHKKRMGIPPPPAPGKIAYAVYQ